MALITSRLIKAIMLINESTHFKLLAEVGAYAAGVTYSAELLRHVATYQPIIDLFNVEYGNPIDVAVQEALTVNGEQLDTLVFAAISTYVPPSAIPSSTTTITG